MYKSKEPVVSVLLFYEGERTARQVFMDLIIRKLKNQESAVDNANIYPYNEDTPNRGEHSGMENCHE